MRMGFPLESHGICSMGWHGIVDVKFVPGSTGTVAYVDSSFHFSNL